MNARTSSRVVVAAVGVILGLAARLVDDIAPRWVGNVGAVWFVVAFFAGRRARRPHEGAILGAIALGAATLAYYAYRLFVDGTISTRYLSRVGISWLIAALVVGAIGGWVGAASRTVNPPWGAPAGVLLGEAAAVAYLRQRWVQVIVEVAAAGVILYLAKRRSRTLKLVTAVTAAAVAAFAIVYRTLLQ